MGPQTLPNIACLSHEDEKVKNTNNPELALILQQIRIMVSFFLKYNPEEFV